MVHTDVGTRCRDCAPARASTAAAVNTRLRNIIIVVGLVFVGVVLIGGGSQLGGGSSDPGDYDEYIDEYFEELEPDVKATQLIDPWQPDSPDEQPSAGRRYLALEVTISNPASSEYPHYVTSSAFKLIDADGFAYGATESLMEPALPEGLQLAAGEKTRGWVMFEIDEETEVESVVYGTAEVALPG